MFRKNVASQFIHFQGVDATTGGIKSGVTWTVRRCIDGTFAAGGGTVTEDSTNGWYKYAMSQADTNGNDIAFNFTGTGAVPQTVNIITTACDPTSTAFGLSLAKTANITGFNDISVSNIWQDTTAGDFTTSSSIGKSIMNGVSLGTGLTVNNLTQLGGQNVALNANNFLKVSLNDILATTLTETSGQLAGGFKKFFNIASPASTMDALTLVATATNLTNLPAITANWLTATGINSGAITSAKFAAGAIDATAIADAAIDRATFAADTGLQSSRSNTATAGGNTSITLDGSASATTDFYTGAWIGITGGTGAIQWRLITAYNGSTKVATVAPAWATNPDNTSTFAILPAAKISGVTLTDTLTTYTGNTVQTGDSFARIGATGSGLTSLAPSSTALSTTQWTNGRAANLDNLDTTVSSRGTSTLTQTQVSGGAYALNSSSFAFNSGLDFTTTQKAATLARVTLVDTVTTLTNLPAITASWLTATGIAADAITAAKIADGAIDAATFAAGAINAAAIAADAITDAKVASDVTIASVTGSVGSVTGAVGSVTGNVGGNVTGSVGSIATGGIAAASFAAGAIDATAIATDALGSLELAAGAASEIATAVASQITTDHGSGSYLTATGFAVAGDAMTLTSAYNFAKGTVAVTESYNADGSAPTPVQALMVIMQMLTEMSISGTTMTIKKLDGSTTALTLTLDNATTPAAVTRTG